MKPIGLIEGVTWYSSDDYCVTSIRLLIKQEDCYTPLFDTTFIHANAAVEFALADNI